MLVSLVTANTKRATAVPFSTGAKKLRGLNNNQSFLIIPLIPAG